jgi:Flp pilus assembly protein TadG
VKRVKWSQFRNDESAAVAPTIALSLFALIAVGGIAFDYARLAGMDSELQNAADHAALAAATQLNGQAGTCDRAIAAARDLLKRATDTGNATGQTTVFSNDGAGPDITIATQAAGCSTSATDPVQFFTTAEGDTFATNESTAKFVQVRIDARIAEYALTPIVGAFNSGAINAIARAGLGSAICKIPPIMICNPNPGTAFSSLGKEGWGIMATGHGNDRSGPGGNVSAWAPGDFGFLEAGAGNNADLIKSLAFQNPNINCLQVETGQVSTGNPQGLYDALNTRFDIYDFSSGNGTTLSPCFDGKCPAAVNVTKDLVKQNTSTSGNSCKIGNQGWMLPEFQFAPGPKSGGYIALNKIDADSKIGAMGLPRDNCHYTSYNAACGNDSNNRFGNGEWARGDYFNKYHSGQMPANASTITRYQTYLWEINQGGISRIPNDFPAGKSAGKPQKNLNQYGGPVCSTGTIGAGQDRRVLSVAVVDNCGSLSGSSTAAIIGEWVDMFLVEPTLDDRGNGATKDQIYAEIIGKSLAGGNGSTSAQTLRRDSPYLVQ